VGIWELILASSGVSIVLILIILGLYAFFSSRGMKKQKEHFTDLHTQLKPGDKVQFSNGLFGTIKRVGKETVDIEVKSGAVIEVSRYAVSEIVKDQ
jgi:preprotein translocase subunit YajC